jgi:hypothetical protein
VTRPSLTDGGHIVPTVTDIEAGDDRDWFARTKRRYRLRRQGTSGSLIRRRTGQVYLRVWAAKLPAAMPHSDEALRPYWFLAAYPELPAAQRAELIKEARQLERA